MGQKNISKSELRRVYESETVKKTVEYFGFSDAAVLYRLLKKAGISLKKGRTTGGYVLIDDEKVKK